MAMPQSAPAWLTRARRAAALPPARPRLPLLLAGSNAELGTIEAQLAARIAAAGLPLAEEHGRWQLAGASTESLAAIARWLHRERICGPWRGELLAVTDTQGAVVGAVERAAVRALGITTFAVHLVGVSTTGAIWVQQRALSKATDPGQWDTLMGGQVGAGETIEATLERETLEEAGLAIGALADLHRSDDFTVRRPVREGYMVEHIAVFRAVLGDALQPVNHDGEVDRFECLGEAALVERLRADEFTLEATLILGAELERRASASRTPGG